MPLYRTESYTTTGTKGALNLDPSIVPFNASVAVTLSDAGTYKLQFSLSPMTVPDADALWFDSVNMPAGTTASAVTNIMFPVARVRIVIAAITGTITLQVSQGISTN